MKKLIFMIAAMGAMLAAVAQTGPQPDPGQGQKVEPKKATTQPREQDWESPTSLKTQLRLTDEQITKLKVSFDRMNQTIKSLDPKKMEPKAYYGEQIKARDVYREEIRKALTPDQKKRYEDLLAQHVTTELTPDEAATLADLASKFREKRTNIENNPNLTKAEKEDLINAAQLELLEKFAGGVAGQKQEKMKMAVKQMKEQIAKKKEDREKKEKEGDKPKEGEKPKDGGDKPKDGSGGGGS